MPCLSSCCRCGTLRTGAIITGVLGIIVGLVSMILVFALDIKFRTIILDFLPQNVVKIIVAISFIMTAIISALLIYGAVERNKFLMLPWIVLGFMLIIGLLITIIWSAVDAFSNDHDLLGSLILVFGLIILAVYIYLWLVVGSYFQLLLEEDNRGPYAKAPYRTW